MTIILSISLPAYVLLCLVLVCSAIMHMAYSIEHLYDSEEFETILGAVMALIMAIAFISLLVAPSLPSTAN